MLFSVLEAYRYRSVRSAVVCGFTIAGGRGSTMKTTSELLLLHCTTQLPQSSRGSTGNDSRASNVVMQRELQICASLILISKPYQSFAPQIIYSSLTRPEPIYRTLRKGCSNASRYYFSLTISASLGCRIPVPVIGLFKLTSTSGACNALVLSLGPWWLFPSLRLHSCIPRFDGRSLPRFYFAKISKKLLPSH
jgi:hypothetical protein